MHVPIDVEWTFAKLAASRIGGAEEKHDKIVFRCPICGDSKSRKHKKRGAFVIKEDGVAYVCKNCNENSGLSWFLKNQFPDIYRDYRVRAFKEGGDPTRFEGVTAGEVAREEAFYALFDKPEMLSTEVPTSGQPTPFDSLRRVCELPQDHIAARFVVGRRLYKARGFGTWRFTDYFGVWAHHHDPEKKLMEGYDPRIVIPCFDREGPLGCQARTVLDAKLKYLTASFRKERTLSYGLDRLDPGTSVWITEGAFDSEALANGIAALHGDLSAFASKMGLDRERAVLLFDNEPSKRETTTLALKAARDDWRLAVWTRPPREIGKDPAEAIFERGLNIDQCVEVRRGLNAEIALARWMGKV